VSLLASFSSIVVADGEWFVGVKLYNQDIAGSPLCSTGTVAKGGPPISITGAGDGTNSNAGIPDSQVVILIIVLVRAARTGKLRYINLILKLESGDIANLELDTDTVPDILSLLKFSICNSAK
jgi:hypothetical protein